MGTPSLPSTDIMVRNAISSQVDLKTLAHENGRNSRRISESKARGVTSAQRAGNNGRLADKSRSVIRWERCAVGGWVGIFQHSALSVTRGVVQAIHTAAYAA